MKKVVIGIIPTQHLFVEDNPYDDYYKVINLIFKRFIKEVNKRKN